MALVPKDIPITREQVYMWLKNWPIMHRMNPDLTLEDYIADEVAELHLPDPEVDTSAMDDWDESTHVVSMILADLPSYGFDYGHQGT
jgi:hypothetical protein